MFATEIKIQSC